MLLMAQCLGCNASLVAQVTVNNGTEHLCRNIESLYIPPSVSHCLSVKHNIKERKLLLASGVICAVNIVKPPFNLIFVSPHTLKYTVKYIFVVLM